MKSFILVSLLSAAAFATAADNVTMRVRFGMKDTVGQDWSGSVSATPGKVIEIRGWRWTPMDKAEGSEWTVKTRPIPAQSSAQREKVRAAKNSYYYIRGEQVPDTDRATGEIVWVSPMWIRYQP